MRFVNIIKWLSVANINKKSLRYKTNGMKVLSTIRCLIKAWKRTSKRALIQNNCLDFTLL